MKIQKTPRAAVIAALTGGLSMLHAAVDQFLTSLRPIGLAGVEPKIKEDIELVIGRVRGMGRALEELAEELAARGAE